MAPLKLVKHIFQTSKIICGTRLPNVVYRIQFNSEFIHFDYGFTQFISESGQRIFGFRGYYGIEHAVNYSVAFKLF